MKARRDWDNRPWEERAEVFLKAADLISGKYRTDILANHHVWTGESGGVHVGEGKRLRSWNN
jgi:1-pyrroline-5-carboxylate dehydrogenase